MAAKRPFRVNAGFGKRIEFWILGEMIRYGLDLYVPLVDDQGIDAIVRKRDGSFVEVQIKARSRNAKKGTETLFSVRSHEKRANFWFVFYSEPLDKMWIMTSQEFVDKAGQTKEGKYKDLWWIKFDTKKSKGVATKFDDYLAKDFSKIEPAPPPSDDDEEAVE